MLDLLTVINGRSWPLTERLRYATGDEVRWRVLNPTNVPHAPCIYTASTFAWSASARRPGSNAPPWHACTIPSTPRENHLPVDSGFNQPAGMPVLLDLGDEAIPLRR